MQLQVLRILTPSGRLPADSQGVHGDFLLILIIIKTVYMQYLTNLQVPLTEAVAKQLRNLNRCGNGRYGYSYYPSYSGYGGGFNLGSLIGKCL